MIYSDLIFTLLDFTRVSWGYISVAHGPTSEEIPWDLEDGPLEHVLELNWFGGQIR